jgi:hypothetical protein
MRKLICIFSIMLFFLSCAGSEKIKENTGEINYGFIWNIYTGYSFENMDKYLESIKELRPKEHEQILQMKEREFSAYLDFENAMFSNLADENGIIVRYHPTSNFINGSEKPHTSKDVFALYEKMKLAPPLAMPYGVVSDFIDTLSEGKFDDTTQFLAQNNELVSQYSEYGLKGFWKKAIRTKNYLQIHIKRVEFEEKDLLKANIYFDLLTFLKPQDQFSNWRFVRVPLGIQTGLDKEGKWFIQKQLQ